MAFFLICPRFRRYWKPSDSDTGRSYQLNPARPSPDGDPEGISSTREDAHSNHHRGSSGLSDRLRRRFSREAKDLRVKPRTQRKSGSPGFPFSSKLANTSKGVSTPDDIGSSLMSERGYDSDAQFISTPKQISHTRDHPTNTRIVQETVSPLRQEIEREESYEQGHGLESEAMANARVDRAVMEEPQPTFHSRNQTSWATQSSGSSAFRADDGSRRARVARPQRGVGGSPVQSKRNGPVYPQQGYRPPLRMATPDPGIPRHGSGYSSPISPVPFPYTTSADSLAGPSQISVRKRRRQPPTGTMSDNCSIHLGDMNIPTMLASCSTSPRILSPKHSFDENRWASNAGTWNAPQPSYDSSGDAPGNTLFSHTTGPRFRRAPVDQSSSCYSPKTSLSSTGIPIDSANKRNYQPTTKELIAEPIAGFNCSPGSFLVDPHHTSAVDSYDTKKVESQKSKFTERFEQDRSMASLGHGLHGSDTDPASPRKVSVGWMSGGRRLGYGYTMVPANDGIDQPSGSPKPGETGMSEMAAINAGSQGDLLRRVESGSTGQTRKTSPRTGDPSFDISSIMSRMRLRSLSSALSEAGSDSIKFSLLEKLKRKKDQGDEVADAKNPWDFCSWVDPNQPVSGQSSPQKSSSVSTKSTEGRPVGRWATLRRTGSLLTKGRSVSAITRGLEAKAITRMTTPAGRYPVARRKEGRMLKFKVLDRKKKARSADDNVPIVPMAQSHGSADSGECQDGHVDKEQMIDTGAGMAERDRHRSSDKTGSDAITDDWKSTYQDCQEMLG
ncbi:hypothetical protein BO94DRAFT_511466 [Aspergillus sclerotioniger CBS 115572]|uniref:Uncharacterized protein n=1 Tax=Aspergillus sclerotioniger CBS 115572 TaxID=1450535 RepID=A0A317X511_9EURO|nr:hypothetical protein BO94DRAFT_511466 [Aspergillus sclerotioniger CBS 115572]PWY93676.1 hypothetical protein BO94DRAFT_511466 [Aspergillus sclerotioniger CBS 115572]